MNEELTMTKSAIQKKTNNKVHETKICLPSVSNWGNSTNSEAKKTPFQSLNEIQTKELALEREKRQTTPKPFHLFQVEERAICELENYYTAVYNNTTPAFFVVNRNLLNGELNNYQNFEINRFQKINITSNN